MWLFIEFTVKEVKCVRNSWKWAKYQTCRICSDFIFYTFSVIVAAKTTSFHIYVDPFKPNGIYHSYPSDQFISILRVAGGGGVFFISIQILIEHSVSKQWRPWPDAAFCVWSGLGLHHLICATKRTPGLYGLCLFFCLLMFSLAIPFFFSPKRHYYKVLFLIAAKPFIP